jgi:putative membrane protein insertion efficiency factor
MTTTPSRSARILDGMIRLYQKTSSSRMPRCRFYPTCSQYAREAITEHGAGKGSWLAVRRLSRCHPLGGHGFDPVPEAPPTRHSHRDRPHRLRGADPC